LLNATPSVDKLRATVYDHMKSNNQATRQASKAFWPISIRVRSISNGSALPTQA
jgi:hypothetical protein